MDTAIRAKDLSQTLARGLRVLDIIAGAGRPVTVRELATATALPRSVVQRLVGTLDAAGYVNRDRHEAGYRLSLKVWGLGCAAVRPLDIREQARPIIQQLVAKCDETVKLAVLEGADVVYIDSIVSSRTLRAYRPIGGRAPAHATATGKAVLAFRPEFAADALGAQGRRLAKDLEEVRRRGYAVNRGELDEEVGAVAAPVFDAHGEAIGSVGIILPTSRLTPAKAIQMGAWLTAAGGEISRRLGCRALEERAAAQQG